MKKGLLGSIVLGVVILLSVVGIFSCTEKIPAGYVGVVYNMSGGVDGEVLTQGFHIVAPTKHVTKYSIAIEQAYLSINTEEGGKNDRSFDIPTSDGKTINVDLEFSYHFDASKVSETFVMFKGQSGKNIEDTFIKGKMKAWAGEVSSTYTVIDVFGDKRAELNTAMKDYIGDKFEDYGIIIDTVNFTRIDTDPETAAAIQKKVNAQQELELTQIQAKTASVNAEKEKAVAIVAAQKEKEVAQLQADARIIKAEAEAKSNKMIAESLTQSLLDKIKYEKWDGTVPKVQGAGQSIVDIRE